MILGGWLRPTSIPARSESQGARINVRRHGAAPMRRIFFRGQHGDFRMSLSPRLMIGFGAGFASMAFVLLAGFTAPGADVTHTASTCLDSQNDLPRPDAGAEAERPA